MKKEYWLDCRDKFAFLSNVMDILAGNDCEMAFVYNPKYFDVMAFEHQNIIVKREKRSDGFDKSSIQLESDKLKIIKEILQHNGVYKKKVLHIEIYKNKQLSVLVGDYFDNECISIRYGIDEDEIKNMVNKGTLRSYVIREKGTL